MPNQESKQRRIFQEAFNRDAVVVKLSVAGGGLHKHEPLVGATSDWFNRASPESIFSEDRLAIGGGMD